MAREEERESLNSHLDEITVDSADLHGNTGKQGYDRSFQRTDDDYEDSELDDSSGFGNDPYLGGSTGLADDIGMHIEEGFSVGYDQDESSIEPDEGNDESYLSLGDAAQGRRKSDGAPGYRSRNRFRRTRCWRPRYRR